MKGFYTMKSKNIKINNLKDLNLFVQNANHVNGDVCIYRGKFCVDGKSLMGAVSLNTAAGCRVEYPDNAIEFENFISKFEF